MRSANSLRLSSATADQALRQHVTQVTTHDERRFPSQACKPPKQVVLLFHVTAVLCVCVLCAAWTGTELSSHLRRRGHVDDDIPRLHMTALVRDAEGCRCCSALALCLRLASPFSLLPSPLSLSLSMKVLLIGLYRSSGEEKKPIRLANVQDLSSFRSAATHTHTHRSNSNSNSDNTRQHRDNNSNDRSNNNKQQTSNKQAASAASSDLSTSTRMAVCRVGSRQPQTQPTATCIGEIHEA